MDEKTTAVKPVQKWADRIRVLGPALECVQEMTGGTLGKLPDFFKVSDLPKTAEESAAIDEVVAAMNVFRCSFCGLPPVDFSPDRVHILSQEEFRKKISPERFQGKAWCGHIYLWRGWPLWMLQAILAHELFHAVSYLWFDLTQPGTVTADGLRLPALFMRRAGLVLVDPSYGTLLPHFHGLNEGATETAAIAIRNIIARRTRLLDEAGKRSIIDFVTSPPLVAFTDRLITIAAGPRADVMGTMKELFLDCLNGTDGFLAQLDARLPGATEVLRRTGARPQELLPAAEELGFTDLVEPLRHYCE